MATVPVSGSAPAIVASAQGVAQINAFPDEKRIRDLAEQIRGRLSHAYQLKQSGTQQQQTASMQVV